MDPKQQPPRRAPGASYISDFVAAPRQAQAAPTPVNPQPTPAVSQLAPVTPQATQQPTQPMPSLINSRPMTSIQPNRPVGAAPAQQPQQAAAPETPRHSSFEPAKVPEVTPRELKVKKPHQGMRDVLSIFGVLASALLLAFCLISFVFQSYQVDGPSMQTTLQNNDHLIVWKVQKTLANLTGKHYIPNRGDVIVFNEHTADSGSGDKQLIKRVIGLPGERVVVKNGEITVYNNQYPNGFSPDKTLPYGKVIVTTPGNVDVTVGENQVYVCGDNRTNSLDSRVFGPIDSKQIVGKLVIRVLPLNTVTKF